MSHPLPARIAPRRVSSADFDRFSALCAAIEGASLAGDTAALAPLLAEWNAKAARAYTPWEFTSFAGAMSAADFVLGALTPSPGWIPDLTFDEACGAVLALQGAALSEAATNHVLQLLEVNLPGSDLGDLLYWPDAWFGDAALLQLALSPAQVVGYAMARAGRTLAGAPAHIELPIRDPKR